MHILAHEPVGYEGYLVSVEVDLRRGIPGVDLVGLAACAVREARERVRVAIRNSGFTFPAERVLINLAPAHLPKEGSSYDLPIALAVLLQACLLPDPGRQILALGELQLDGKVRPVRGILPAVSAAATAGHSFCIVPFENAAEARAVNDITVYPISNLTEAIHIMNAIGTGTGYKCASEEKAEQENSRGICKDATTKDANSTLDMAELRGQPRLRRAMEIAAAGGHNMLLFGPPGTGKTMAGQRFISLLPDLTQTQSVQVASLYSLSGFFGSTWSLRTRPPLRSPHHSASLEGMIGGGKFLRPGEISLAHLGVLFLDEATEFRNDLLQSLREPIEEGSISLARAGSIVKYPASFQLIMAANPCPCGNAGRQGRMCLCSQQDLQRYQKKLGGPLMDRIDIRIPVDAVMPSVLIGDKGESSSEIQSRVKLARERQLARFKSSSLVLNAKMRPEETSLHCALSSSVGKVFETSVEKLQLSSRASHAIVKIARSIADLADRDCINEEDIMEAVQHRRLGEMGELWPDSFV